MAAKVRDGYYRCPLPNGCGDAKPKHDFYAPRTKRNEVSHYCKKCQSRHKREREAEDRRRQAEFEGEEAA